MHRLNNSCAYMCKIWSSSNQTCGLENCLHMIMKMTTMMPDDANTWWTLHDYMGSSAFVANDPTRITFSGSYININDFLLNVWFLVQKVKRNTIVIEHKTSSFLEIKIVSDIAIQSERINNVFVYCVKSYFKQNRKKKLFSG